MSESEIREIVRKVLKNEMKSEMKKIAQEEAKEVAKKTMHSYHKWMWEKKGMWMNQI